MTTTHSYAYDKGSLTASDFTIDQISDYIKKKTATVWIDLINPAIEIMSTLSQKLGLHELAVEDALEVHQRPKVDYYADHLFLACHALTLNKNLGTLDTNEIYILIKDNCIITVRHNDNFSMEKIIERNNANVSLEINTSFLLYNILDNIIDTYLDVVTQLDEYYDQVSEDIFTETNLKVAHTKRWFNMRRSLVQFHRVIISMREATNILLRREHNIIAEGILPYFHDTYDHLVRISESTDVLRELVATIVDTNLNIRDYRQNQIMKQVTSWAAIVAVPTLVTGFYGMNVPYPGFSTSIGLYVSLGLMVGASLFLYMLFKRKDWI